MTILNAELVKTCILALILIAFWRLLLRPAICGLARDNLFDLRERVREFYLKDGRNLENPRYAALRTAINGQIRYLDGATFLIYTVVRAQIKNSPERLKEIRAEATKLYQTDDPQEAEFIDQTRTSMTQILNLYICFSTFFMAILVICICLIIVPAALCWSVWGETKPIMVKILWSMPFRRETIEAAPECDQKHHSDGLIHA